LTSYTSTLLTLVHLSRGLVISTCLAFGGFALVSSIASLLLHGTLLLLGCRGLLAWTTRGGIRRDAHGRRCREAMRYTPIGGRHERHVSVNVVLLASS